MGWEEAAVERPFIEQLVRLGWRYMEGDLEDPARTGRTAFTQVFQEDTLRSQLRALNLRDGKPWLDDARIAEAVAALTRIPAPRLMEANQVATELLLKGITVDGLPGWHGGRGQTIQYIDWERPERNEFTVINQYRVDCPPGYDRGKAFIVPDLVLLVNGIPLVVIECKSPNLPEPMVEAVDQLRRYSNQRFASGEVADNEGNEALFHTNQLLIATSFDHALVGSIGAELVHFGAWKTVAPRTEAEIAAELGKSSLSEQERLVAGLLAPAQLLDVVRHYVIFMQMEGRTIKVVPRHQQYRAVVRAVERLRTGKTRLQDGEHDRRGGVIWHTQGSGKSLTMVFLVRKLRTDPELRRFKVVFITDRKDLEKQLSATAALTGETASLASSIASWRAMVARHAPDIIFATLQKQRGDAYAELPLTTADLPPPGVREHRAPEVLNEDDSILLLVDEAHRGHGNDLHAWLMASVPNAAKIGFTGTPILMGDKKRTHEIFGDFIDQYTIREAEGDHAIVPVLYEGRTAQGAVKDGANLDELFEDLFGERSPEELEEIRRKYATKGNIFEAPRLIEDKARDMLRHYVTNILPNGLKAQIVAYSRLAVTRYYTALQSARDTLLNEAEALSDAEKGMDEEALCHQTAPMRARVQAWRYREILRKIEFAPVISGSNNDDPAWKDWTEASKQENRIKRFKMPLMHKDPAKADPLAFLIVKSMLLTGFDAPIEGVMYLDRPIKEAELLQTVARVNRTGHGKEFGIVVDYFGLAHHLKHALSFYADSDVEGALRSLKDELPVLRDRHFRVTDLFRRQGLDGLHETEACVEALADERLRAEFSVKLKQFLDSLDLVLPRPEALPYSADAKRLALIYVRARNRYRDTPILGKDVGAKVRRLIDEHVISLGIDPKIPPISLTDADFDKQVNRAANQRAKASEMEHAIRAHIREHYDQDPVLYRKLSERLTDLLHEMGEQWERLTAALEGVIGEIRAGHVHVENDVASVPEEYLPFLRLLTDAAAGNVSASRARHLVDLTVELVDSIADEVTPNFWRPANQPARDALATRLFEILMKARIMPAADIEALTDKFMELARANLGRLTRA